MVKATRWRARLRAIRSDGERAKRAIRSGGGVACGHQAPSPRVSTESTSLQCVIATEPLLPWIVKKVSEVSE